MIKLKHYCAPLTNQIALFTVVILLVLPNFVIANHIASTNSFAQKILLQWQQLVEKSTESFNFPLFSSSQNNTMMMAPPCPGGAGVIGGKVVGDFNYNGEDDQDAGLGGVNVFLYNCLPNGTSNFLTSVTTDGLGEYFFSGLNDGQRYRLEYVPPALLEYNDGRSGTVGGPSVQFITSPSCGVNASFAHPVDFCQANPDMAATCFVNGDPLAAGSEGAAIDALVSFNWDNMNSNPTPNELANAGEIGAAYGLAFDRKNERLYISAFIKRFAGLGSLGIGGIYTLDASNLSNPTVSSFIDVETLNIDVGNIPVNGPTGRNLPLVLEDPSNDATAYDKVATEGIGALEYNNGKLWFVNLFDKTVYAIDISNGTPTTSDVEAFPLPNPGCTGGVFRPFALKIFRNKVYAGGVCDASASQDKANLEAFVYQLNGNTFTEILNFSLDYDKGYAANATDCENFVGWYPWLTNGALPAQCHANITFVSPTPVLSDLEFDIDGSMILGFMDRMGHQLGNKNWPLTGNSPLMTNISGGDILRAHYNNGVYVLENNGAAGTLTANYEGVIPGNAPTTGNFSGVGNMQGPGGGEFYFNDLFNFPISSTNTPHTETSQGDLAFYPGAGRVATTALDPLGTSLNVGGVNFMSNTTGETRFRGYRLFQTSNSSISTFSKANGLGALVNMCDLGAPSEIGGYLWDDENDDGVQDACEPALVGINVTLIDNAGNEIGTTTTDADGEYYFNENTLNTGTIQPATTYHIVAGTGGQFDPNIAQLSGTYFVTNQDIGGGQTPDKTDSDAALASNSLPGNFMGFPFITIMTGGEGFVRHSYDFGFTSTNANPVAAIGGRIFNDANNNGIQDPGENGIGGINITIYDGDFNELSTMISNPDGTYCFLNMTFGNYSFEFDPNNAGNSTSYMFSQGNVGSDDTADSDPDENTGRTASFLFDPVNGNNKTYDAGLFSPNGNIGGSVFDDLNGNGIQESGEGNIQRVKVDLLDVNNGNAIISSELSDVNGNYTFSNLETGNYILAFDITTNLAGVTNYQGSPQHQGGNDEVDSDQNPANGQTALINFNPTNGSLNNVDAGFFAEASVGGFAWNDDNEDGILNNGENGLGGVTVTLFDGNGNQIGQTTTLMDGSYSFPEQLGGDYYVIFNTGSIGNIDYQGSPQNQGNNDAIDSDANPLNGQTMTFNFDSTTGDDNSVSAGFFLPNGTIGGFVFNDANVNSLIDVGETGIEGVTVNLLDINNNLAVIATQTTNASGNYAFTGQLAGVFIVEFDETTNTAGATNYIGSAQNQGNGTNDSDPDPNTGFTNLFLFNPLDGNNNDVDAGFFQTASIGGFAFGDADGDGVFDANEQGIANVTVTLFDAADNNLESAMTNGIGVYEFPNLTVGDYYVAFNTASTGNNNYEGTLQNQGNNDAIDSDADPTTGQTETFTFNPANGSNTNVSAGYSLPFGTVGDFVFKDCNNNGIQDSDETGIAGVEVILSNLDNSVTLASLTNTSGFYLFMDVPAGNYTLSFNTTGAGLDYTLKDQGSDENLDSDVNPNGKTDSFVTGGGGGMITNIDAGFIDVAAPFITNIPDLTVECDTDITSIVKAVDNCDTDPALSFEDVSIDGICPMFIIREWTATDDCGNTVTNTQKITLNDTTPPTITLTTPLLNGVPNGGSVTLECDEADTIMESDAVYGDNCDSNPFTNFTEAEEEGVCEDDGYYLKRTLTWYAEDDCGNFTQVTVIVFITDTTPPVVSLPTDLTVDCNSIPPIPVLTVTDNCDDDLQLDFEEVLLGDTCGIYEIVRSWFYYDDCLNVAWVQQKILVTVDNFELEDAPDDITIECDENKPPFSILTATNDCSPSTVDTMTLILPYNEATCSQECIRVWTATDDCGNEETTSQLITIVDTTPPVIEFNHPALGGLMDGDSVTYDCTEAIPFGPNDVTATDNCNEVNVDFMEMETFGDCDVDGFFIRLECCWKADDGCGNKSQICIIVRITDEQKPILLGIPEDITVNQAFENIPPPALVTATDLCDNNVDIAFVESEAADPDGCGFTIIRTWIATDDCGNSCSDSQIITVDDVCDCPNILVNGTTIVNADCSQTNGSITVDVNIDPTLYDFLLLPNLGTQNPDGNTFTDLAPGIYIIIINLPDFPDCNEKIYFDIMEEDCVDFLQATIQGEQEACLTANELNYNGVITSTEIFQPGNSTTVECTNIDGECVMLTPAAGYLGTSPDQIGIIHCFNGNPNQCDTTYITVTVEAAPLVCNIAIAAENVTQPTCQNALGSIEVSVSGMEGELSYTWSPNVSSTDIVTDLTVGNYALTVTDLETSCTAETTIVIENITAAALTASDIAMADITCFGENNGSIISNTTLTYDISNDDGAVGQTPMNNLPAGVYTVSNTTPDCSASLIIEIAEPDELKVNFANTPESCLENDGTITLEVEGGLGAMTYNWDPAVSNSTVAVGLTATQTYSVTVTDATGCETILENLTIIQDCQPCNLQLTVNNQANETCMNANGSIQLSAANQNGTVAYTWSPTVSTTNSAFGLAEGTYEVAATDEFGCTTSTSAVINRSTPTWAATSETTATTCGQANGSATITVTDDPGTLTYAWSPNVSTTNTAENIAAGNYTITITDENACQMEVAVTVESTPVDWAIEAIAVDASCGQADGSVMITNTGIGVYTYTWQPSVSDSSSAVNLSVGLYQITVTDENGCEQISNAEVLENEVQFSAIPNTQNATCAANDGIINIDVTSTGVYTFTWTNNVSTTNEATNLLAGESYSATVTDENDCSIILSNLNIGIDCVPTNLTITDTVACEESSIDLCINLFELIGDLQGVTVCQQPQNGALSFVSDTCFTYSPMPDFNGSDTICFVACDLNNVCDTTTFVILVEECNMSQPCEDFIPQEEVLAQTADCAGLAEVCIKVGLSEMLSYAITDNGVAYTRDLVGCMNDSTFSYNASVIPDSGNNGPYEVTWEFNGTSVSGTFDNIDGLISFMNDADPIGDWIMSTTSTNIESENLDSAYGVIVVTQTATGATANLVGSTGLIPSGTALFLAVGTHEMIFTDINECTDTMVVEVFCIESETVAQEVLLNNDGTYCFDDAQVPGTAGDLQVICDNCDILDFTVDGNCINYTGLELGTVDFILVICDDNDLCDTVFLTINVVSSGILPVANIDSATTQIEIAVTIPVLDNDNLNETLVTLTITEDPLNGTVLVDGNNVIYFPNEEYCGLDAFSYEICNQNGCDVATVNLLIECVEPFPMSGFSPNGDDINDGFMIKNVDMFPNNELLIYDRWGNRVFQELNYNSHNLWKGTYRNLILPDGTYFYMFTYGEGERKTGYVQIHR